jgi:Na+-translocating ferredoxin:NAD+ oxidoreductase RnfG subunit
LESAQRPSRKHRREFLDRLLAIIALATIVAAYIYGLARAGADVEPAMQPTLERLLPSAQRFEPVSDTIYAGYRGLQTIGYVTTGDAIGYGGMLKVAVAVDPQGKVIDFVIVDHLETPEYLTRVENDDFPDTLLGKSCQDPFRVGQDVDGISGATYTAAAIAEAVGEGCRQASAGGLGMSISSEAARFQFGVPEITVILLFAVGFFGHRRQFKYTRQARWISMIAGMLILGFWLNRPLTIGNINQLLLGFWPSWQTNLYWYLLIGGILLVFTADNKNPYCEWFCPLGAVQECLGAAGMARAHSPGVFKDYLKWVQRGLAWLAIVLALVFRNPTISSYEVFGALFARVGTTVLFVLLGIVLAASLFIRRPWCTYLCPLRPVDEIIRMARRWILDLWK